MSSYHKNLHVIRNGSSIPCYKRSKYEGDLYWWSVSITWTNLNGADELKEIWEHCKSKLEVLNLTHNCFEMLPNELAIFDGLELLCASYNCFTSMPDVIFELKSLLHLNMVGNQIFRLPTDVGRLNRLTSLFLGSNKLRYLPDVFDKLPELLEAGFNHNYLSGLPPSFACLKKLKRIELGHNRFTQIPEELLKLDQLQSLHIEYNRIQWISHEHFTGVKLTETQWKSFVKKLKLKGNPLQESDSLPPKANHSYQLNTLACKFSGSLRILVLGKCGSGKTSVTKAFDKGEYVTPVSYKEHDHTVGINQHRIAFSLGGTTHEIVLWDFAGEKEAAIINEIFLSECTLIWLVVNIAEYDDKSYESYKEHVGCWIGSLLTHFSKPTIWIVATHTDKLEAHEIKTKCFAIQKNVKEDCIVAARSIKGKSHCYLGDLTSPYGQSQIADPMYVQENLKVFPLTNTHSFKGLDDLKESLQHLPTHKAFQHLKNPLEGSWVTALQTLNKESNRLISQSTPPIVSECSAHEVIQPHIPEQEERQSFLRYQHQNGEIHILSSQSHNGSVKIVLDVPWLIDLLKQIFRHDFDAAVKKQYELHSQFRKYLPRDTLKVSLQDKALTGVINEKLLRALWLLEGVEEDTFDTIADLLTTFGLAHRVNSKNGYLFPWLLPSSSDDVGHLCVHSKLHITIRYSFADHCNLVVLFTRFMVHCCEQVSEICSTTQRSFQVESDACSLHVHIKHGQKIEIRACTPIPGSYSKLWKLLMLSVNELEGLLQEWSRQHFDRFVLCPYCVQANEIEPQLFPLESIRTTQNGVKEPRLCPVCSSSIAHQMIEPPVEYISSACGGNPFYSKGHEISKEHSMEPNTVHGCGDVIERDSVPQVIERLKFCQVTVSKDDCIAISKKVEMKNEDWPMFLTKLGWSRAGIDEQSSLTCHVNKCFEILDKWVLQNGKYATVAALADAVLATGKYPQWSEALDYLDRQYCACNYIK